MKQLPPDAPDPAYFMGLYSQALVISLVRTLRETGVLSDDEIRATFHNAALFAIDGAEDVRRSPGARQAMLDAYRTLMDGAVGGQSQSK